MYVTPNGVAETTLSGISCVGLVDVLGNELGGIDTEGVAVEGLAVGWDVVGDPLVGRSVGPLG